MSLYDRTKAIGEMKFIIFWDNCLLGPENLLKYPTSVNSQHQTKLSLVYISFTSRPIGGKEG